MFIMLDKYVFFTILNNIFPYFFYIFKENSLCKY